MRLTIVFGRVVARTACAGMLFALCGGPACSSGNGATPAETTMGGAVGGTSGSTGGNTSSNGTGGTLSTGGSPSGTGGVAASTGGSGANSTGGSASNGTGGLSGVGGRSSTTGGSGANSTGGSSVRATGGTVSSGGAVGDTGGSTARATGGSSNTGGSTARATGGSSNTAGSSARGTGGLNGTGGHVGGASGATGGASSTAGTTSISPGFDPCPATGDCKILPLGDSITAGAGAQPGDNGGYRVELFTKAVADSKHITFVGSLTSGPSTVSGQTFPKNHEGHIGWTITQVNGIATTAQTVSVSGTSYPGALRDMPNIVLLFIGTNDEGYASSQAGASDRLATLIDKIIVALPNALLVVSSIYPFPGCNSTGYTPTQCAANVATYNAAIPGVVQQRVAQGKHVLFVDMSTPPTGALSTDGVHPNDTVGYPWMGDTWYGVIKSYLH
jgi:hypothetical protein